MVVQHLDPHHKSHLASVLARKTRKPVKEAEDGEPISQSTIYIGPPDEHLLVAQGRIQLAHSRLIRFSRPSIDLLFAAVAAIYGVEAGHDVTGMTRFGERAESPLRKIRLAQSIA